MSGIIGKASIKNFEQSELDIKVLTPPEWATWPGTLLFTASYPK
jgi:hypothetical protein